MKPVNYTKAGLYKWALAGTLLASLGGSISFNPESKFVARNEFKTHGEMALAVKKPDPKRLTSKELKALDKLAAETPQETSDVPQIAEKPAAKSVAAPDKKEIAVAASDAPKNPDDRGAITIPIDDYTEAHGYFTSDKKILWEIRKKADAKTDGATYCIECVSKFALQTLDLEKTGINDSMKPLIQLIIKKKAISLIADLPDKANTVSDSDSESDSESKQKRTAFNIKSECNVKDFTSGSRRDHDLEVDFGSLFECQSQELENAVASCQDQVDKEIKQKSLTKSNRKYSRSHDREDREDFKKYKICDKAAMAYARKLVVPRIKSSLATMEGHGDGIQAIQDFFGNYGILSEIDGVVQIQNELARDLSRADASETLQFLGSDQLKEDLVATGTCTGFMASQEAYGNCMQTAQVMAGRLNYSNLQYSDWNALRVDGFGPAAAQIFTSSANNAKNMLMSTNGPSFVSVLQNLANSGANGAQFDSNTGNPLRTIPGLGINNNGRAPIQGQGVQTGGVQPGVIVTPPNGVSFR